MKTYTEKDIEKFFKKAIDRIYKDNPEYPKASRKIIAEQQWSQVKEML